jgi:hypothetical protein
MTLGNIRVQRKTLEELEEQFGTEMFRLSAVGIGREFIGITFDTNVTQIKNTMYDLTPFYLGQDASSMLILAISHEDAENLCLKIMNFTSVRWGGGTPQNDTATTPDMIMLKYQLLRFYCAYNIYHSESPPSFFLVI